VLYHSVARYLKGKDKWQKVGNSMVIQLPDMFGNNSCGWGCSKQQN